MSDLVLKRKRHSRLSISFQESILSVFGSANDVNNEARYKRKTVTAPSSTELPTKELPLKELGQSVLSRLCDRLVCMSTEGGCSALEALKWKLHQRTCDASELARVMFLEEDAEIGPPLCVVVDLLREHYVHIADLTHEYIIQKALFELSSPEICLCRGTHFGINALIQYLLDDVRGGRCDAVLRQLVSVLFDEYARNSTSSDNEARFLLATMVISSLENEWKFGHRLSTFIQWVQQAVTPSRFLPVNERDDFAVSLQSHLHVLICLFFVILINSPSCLKKWTPELSGIATQRNTTEYLKFGKSENDALVSLFGIIPAADAAKVYLHCISDILKKLNIGNTRRVPVAGMWSRLVLLGNRIKDKKRFSDADENLERSIVSSITGTLCSTTCYENANSVAIVICLARRILIPSETEQNQGVQAFEKYNAWFRDLIARSGDEVISALLDPLSQLIPFESLEILKLNYRVFSASRFHFGTTANYVALVRARIRDFDPSFSRVRVAEENKQITRENSKPSAKVMQDVIQFVSEFSKSRRKLSSALVRQMNFHRYHFRKITLPTLLHPDFIVLQPDDGNVSHTMTPELFDERRIEMIEEIAFKRKDHAITYVEAKEAIKMIIAANRDRAVEKEKSRDSKMIKLATADIEETSSVRDMIVAVLKDETEHGFNGTQACSGGVQIVQNAKNLLRSNVASLISQCNGKDELATFALELLQNLISAIENVEQERGQLSLFSETNGNLLDQYSDWWAKTGRSLLWLISHVFSDSSISQVHADMQYQILMLLCSRISSVSGQKLLSFAMVIAVLAALHKRPALCDLCFVATGPSPLKLRHLAFVIFDCLPLSTPGDVVASTMFAIESVCLFKAFTGSEFVGLESQEHESDFGISDFVIGETSLVEFSKPLWNLLQWILCNPWRMELSKHQNEFWAIHSSFLPPKKVFQKTVRLCQGSSTDTSLQQLLIDVLSFELRCGWGRKNMVATFLRGLMSFGIPFAFILHTTVTFLSRKLSDQHGDAEWIWKGLLIFHDELDRFSQKADIEDSAAFYVQNCVEMFGGSVAYRMVEFYHLMEFDYFQGCEDVEGHIKRVIINLFWPLPKRLILYFWRCLQRTNETNFGSNHFLTANCALLHSKEILPTTVEHGRNHKYKMGQMQISRIACTLHMLIWENVTQAGFDNDKNGILLTQMDSTKVLELSGCNYTFALGIALGMHFGRMTRSESANETVMDEMRRVIRMLKEQVEISACCDVLDSAIIACALLPFSRWSKETENSHPSVKWTDQILQTLINERLFLCSGRKQLKPFWFREILSDDGWKDDGDVRQLLDGWNEIVACRGLVRVLSTFGSLGNEGIGRVIESVDRNSILNIFLPNLTWAYSLIATVPKIWAAELRRDLVRGIGKLSSCINEIVDGSITAILTTRFGNIGIEIANLLNSGAYG